MTTITGPNISGNIVVIGEPFNLWSVNVAKPDPPTKRFGARIVQMPDGRLDVHVEKWFLFDGSWVVFDKTNGFHTNLGHYVTESDARFALSIAPPPPGYQEAPCTSSSDYVHSQSSAQSMNAPPAPSGPTSATASAACTPTHRPMTSDEIEHLIDDQYKCEPEWPSFSRSDVTRAIDAIESRCKEVHALDHKVQEILDDLRREVVR